MWFLAFSYSQCIYNHQLLDMKRFPYHWLLVQRFSRWMVNPHKWSAAWSFNLCPPVQTCWTTNRVAGDLHAPTLMCRHCDGVCKCAQTYRYRYTYTYIYISTCMCVRVCVAVYVYVYHMYICTQLVSLCMFAYTYMDLLCICITSFIFWNSCGKLHTKSFISLWQWKAQYRL